jgi:asparagine synthase (glutamine-hydrolysing)
MCGIAGILRLDPDAADPGRVSAMQHALRHRGPDDRGTWQSGSTQATFGHTRLAVIDLTAAGHQPMSCADGRYTIVFNGEIYNFKELRRTLEGRGLTVRTRTDTEVILHAYAAFGESCVDHLRGMFAFAIWDEQERTAFLARDRFGIKPLYYHLNPRALVFASEVRALLASGVVPRQVDGEAMYEYFRAGSVQDPRTLLTGVRSLEAGHVMVWRAGQARANRYWDLSFAPGAQESPEETTRAALLDSVQHHFVSDVPVGVFLSGGIDSTSLVALATRAGVRDLHTFTLSLPGSPHDESERARRTAEHFGTNHAEFRVDAAEGQKLFGGFLRAMDQPSIDGLNTFAVSSFAHGRGMKVMLSGLGADEIFGGYKSFRDVPAFARWHRRLGVAPPLRAALTRLLTASDDPRHRRLADMLGQPPGIAAAYASYRGIFTRAEAGVLAERYTGRSCANIGERADQPHADPTPEDEVSRLELTRYVRNQLLRESDVMSMAFGLELRTPFLDSVLMEAVSQVPACRRLAPGKRLLLDAVPDLPDGIAFGPKRVFQFPFQDWLRGEWQETFASVDRTCPVPTGSWYRKWCVLVLEHWLSTVNHEGRTWT